ncbi:MAG TPA: fumarate reductase cytochrome b subunit [Casimicrobiaceae bacterium]|nr:fumarate reductase cytochrome b subunit [Casimicrobiaceae bacterium]
MDSSTQIIAGAGLTDRARKSRWPARLDLWQSATGLLLVVFMWAHMFFVSSILISRDAMWTVTRLFEGYFVFGRSYPAIVSTAVAIVIGLFVAHALLAMRKFPISYRQLGTFRGHMRVMHHEDTTLWFWQVFTGFAMFFLASVHLYLMLTRPDRIGPFESADRVWSDHLWPLYLLLLLAVELHGGIGLYRLALKWGWLGSVDASVLRRRLKALKWSLTVFFLVLGLTTLVAYIRIGIEHQARYGERYVPSGLPAPR